MRPASAAPSVDGKENEDAEKQEGCGSGQPSDEDKPIVHGTGPAVSLPKVPQVNKPRVPEVPRSKRKRTPLSMTSTSRSYNKPSPEKGMPLIPHFSTFPRRPLTGEDDLRNARRDHHLS